MNEKPASIYRCFSVDGELLYIGCSANVKLRIVQHRSSSAWFGDVTEITTVDYPTKHEALKAEAAAIMAEQPRHNVRHNHAATDFAEVVPEFHTTADIAKAMGVHVSTISRMVARGEITPMGRLTGLRGAFLFHSSEVNRLRRAA